MSLLVEVVRILERRQIPHALIGAAALAIRGVSRSTADIDILTVAPGLTGARREPSSTPCG